MSPNVVASALLLCRTAVGAHGARQLLALLASAAAHAALFSVIETSGSAATEARHGVPAQTVLSVRLEAVRAPAAEQAVAVPDAHDEAILQRLRERPPAADPSPPYPAPALGIVTPPEPLYHPARALTEKTLGSLEIPADVAATLDAETPHVARLRLLINEHGTVDQVVVRESNFSEADLQLLIAVFSAKTFVPGKIDGQAVKSELLVDIANGK